MMKIIFFTSVFLIFCPPLHAQGLTPAECDEVRQTYGIISEGCADALGINIDAPTPAPDAATADPRTAAQIESHIFFPAGGTAFDNDAQARLAQIKAVLQTQLLRPTCIQLTGHSDASGSAAANLALSQRRAKQVADALVAAGLDPQRIKEIRGASAQAPLDSLPARSRWQRRVAIELRHCPEFTELH